MITKTITTADQTRIVYDVTGRGPALLLLHGGGGGQSRLNWHRVGYVNRLRNIFTVITMDLRGHGQSGKPTSPAFYAIDTLCQDILAVSDACRVDRFILWGFSFGGNISRYLASRSNRISRLIIIGIPFGPAASGDFRQFILDYRARWQPVVEAYLHDSLDLASLNPEDRVAWEKNNIPVSLAWLTAMLDWGENEPKDINCPTLWLAGSKNETTIASMQALENILQDTQVRTHVVAGLTHMQEFEEIEAVYPTLLAFTRDEEAR